MRNSPFALSSAVVAALVVLTGCSALTSNAEDLAATPSAYHSAPTPPPSTTEPTDLADAFAERDAFLAAQQLPLDGSPLVAITDAQKQFIAEQRAYVEQNGGTFDAQSESIALALASDGCETSILNGHEFDADLLRTHVSTAKLIDALIPADTPPDTRTTYEGNLVSLIVFGTSFLCPADHDQWQAAYAEVYGG